jgi:hypothetical protein
MPRSDRLSLARFVGRLGDSTTARATATVVSATVRALAAAVAGIALTAGLSLVLWALTPDSGSDAGEAVRSGAVAFASAHFLPVTISGTALTLRPLLLTAVMIAIIMTAVGHTRAVRGRALEALHAGVFTIAYGLSVSALVVLATPAGSAGAGLFAPAAVAALGALLSLGQGATDWHAWWVATVPEWVRRSFRAAAATVLALIAASAAVLAAALAVSLPDALGIAQLTVHSVGDSLGVVLLCLAFVPNAVIAAIGYVSGAGFSVGAGTFSPLAVHTAELPAVPLLAAVPDTPPGVAAWATMLAPVAAALVGAGALRRVGASRWQRLAAVGLTAVAVGAVTAGLAAAGRGGVAGGSWAAMGTAPLIVGGAVAGTVLLVTASLVVPPGWAALGRRSEHGGESSIELGSEHGSQHGIEVGSEPGGEDDAARGARAEAPAMEGDLAPDDAAVVDAAAGSTVVDEALPEDGVIGVSDGAATRDAQPDDPLADASDGAPTDTAPGAAAAAAAADADPADDSPDSGGELAQAG